MIRITYERKGGRHRLTVTGHAEYDTYGRDIVCAGVSAVSYTLLGFLEQEGVPAPERLAPGEIIMECGGGGRIDAAFDMAIVGYQQIARRYPHYVGITISAATGG